MGASVMPACVEMIPSRWGQRCHLWLGGRGEDSSAWEALQDEAGRSLLAATVAKDGKVTPWRCQWSLSRVKGQTGDRADGAQVPLYKLEQGIPHSLLPGKEAWLMERGRGDSTSPPPLALYPVQCATRPDTCSTMNTGP